MTPEQVGHLEAQMTASVDFHPRREFFAVLTRSATANMYYMTRVMRSGFWWGTQLGAIVSFVPTTAFFLWLALRIVDAGHTGMDRRIVKAALMVAGLCPLLLQVLGMDIYRWYALAGLTSFLVLTIVYVHYRDSAAELALNSRSVQNVAIFLIAINLATGAGLFDGYRVDTFPFVDHGRGLAQWLMHGRHWIQPKS